MTVASLIFLSICVSLASASKPLDQQLAEIRRLPELTQKKIAVIMGAIVGDSAATPLQWIYDEKVHFLGSNLKLEERVIL